MQFTAQIIAGLGIGRQLGYPTLNLEIPKNFELAAGVYACRIQTADQKFKAILFFGSRQTLGIETPTLEIHAFNFSENLQPEELTVEIRDKIRGQKKFANRAKLTAAIKHDCEAARDLLN